MLLLCAGKQCLAGVESLAQSPACRKGTRVTGATKASDDPAPWRVP